MIAVHVHHHEIDELQAEKVRSSLYDLNWEDYDLATRKMVLLMVLASTPNRTLKMGNIFALNMENFARVGDMNMSCHGWEMDTYKIDLLSCSSSKSVSLCALYSRRFKCTRI